VLPALARRPGLHDYGAGLTLDSYPVRTDQDLRRMVSLIRNPERRRPVVVFAHSEDGRIDATSEASAAAKSLGPLAHVFECDADACRALEREVGRRFAVWDGAVRTYHAGFDADHDEGTEHPPATRDWITRRFGRVDGLVRAMKTTFAGLTSRDVEFERRIPTHRAVKEAVLHARVVDAEMARAVAGSSAARSEREELLALEVSLLKSKVAELESAYEFADSEVVKAESGQAKYRAQMLALRHQNAVLARRLAEKVPDAPLPENFETIDEWALEHLAGRLVLLQRAARAARKSPFEDIELVYRCLVRLGTAYVDARRDGVPVEDLFDDLGVKLERTGDESRLSQWREQYFVPNGRENAFLEWHLKRGSRKDDKSTLRIYFFYDEDDQVVVVGHLPGHLDNEKT